MPSTQVHLLWTHRQLVGLGQSLPPVSTRGRSIAAGEGVWFGMKLGYQSTTWGPGVAGDPSWVTYVRGLHHRSPGFLERAMGDISPARFVRAEMFDGDIVDETLQVLSEVSSAKGSSW